MVLPALILVKKVLLICDRFIHLFLEAFVHQSERMKMETAFRLLKARWISVVYYLMFFWMGVAIHAA